MSIFSNIIKDLTSFAHKFEKFLSEVAGEMPTIEKIAATTLTFVGPILQTVITMTAGAPAGALVGAVISKAQTDLAAVTGLLTVVGPTPTVASILNGVVSDLSSLTTAANITDPKTLANIQLVLKELQALVNAFPAAAAPATITATAPAPAMGVAAALPAIAAALAAAASAPAAPVVDPAPAVAAVVDNGPGLHAVVTA